MPNILHDEMSSLLNDWAEGLLRQQTGNGGLMCPDCGFIHGRCADALYPFLRLARHGDPKWIEAAIAVQKWSDCVSRDDGAFINDPPENPWTGITVFASLSLSEALHFHGGLLPASARQSWTNRLRRAADWIANCDWAQNGTINYPISAAAALASASRVLNDAHLLDTARKWAHWSRDCFLPDGLLFGEGAREPTTRGFYAVDALYNLEESLPNLALYAAIAGDDGVRDLVLKSFDSHMDFVLPDGSYNAGWGSRAFKWTLWGSRTSDGIAGLLPLARFDARIEEVVRRNVAFLRSCTHDGLLFGGPHLQNHGRAACLHHTFAHAKALTFALDASASDATAKCALPCDAERGIWMRDFIGTTFVSIERWRASFTVSDVFYGARGSRPSGGALTMLWHQSAGPLCVSSMSRYTPIESRNMAPLRAPDEIAVLTPRLENGAFSSELDLNATLESDENSVTARGRLTSFEEVAAQEFALETRFQDDCVYFRARGQGAVFVLPIVSPDDETVEWENHRVVIHKPCARVEIESSAAIAGDARRIFHFVPGIQAVNLHIAVPAEGVRVTVKVLEVE